MRASLRRGIADSSFGRGYEPRIERSDILFIDLLALVPNDRTGPERDRRPRPETPPAAGERRAIGGYQPQYRVTAALILERLRDSSLEWVRLADQEAGRLDDAQIATPGRLDALQVKWSRFPGTLTFHQLVTPSADAPSLIAQLADGWRRLSAANPGRRVVVHLVTNDRPSTNDELPGTRAPGEPAHFAAFLAQYWAVRAADFADAALQGPERWRAAWDALVRASGLVEAEFERFARDCRLDLERTLPDDTQRASSAGSDSLARAREAAAWREDLDALNGALFRIVAERQGRVQLSRDELLVELGWRERAEFRSRHEFPDPTIPYHEITGTARDLDGALAQHPGGYLILLGTPGSGKSTLLTRTLRYRAERVVRYYAYVPDSPEPNARRGESVNFLHDLVLALDRRGFLAGDALARPDVDLLASRLQEQLRRLGEDYRATGRKTLIVVDGLDHIAREQAPSRPLLADLPAPGQVPDGVYFILGSQTDQLPGLPYEVGDQIQEPERRLQMRRLSRESVVAVVAGARLAPAPDADETERVFVLSDGHPLALAYILNKLRSARGAPTAEVLADVEPFHERIDAQYIAHWRQVEGDRSLVRLLAKLARVRGTVDLSWVEKWADLDALYRLHSRFGHYFRREPDGRLHFFHNSFRIFLLQRTRVLPGVSSVSGDAVLFGELAEHCAAAPDDDPVRWDELFYRSQAGDHEGVLAGAAGKQFRRQFIAGRPAERIQSDAIRALAAAEERGDVVAFARLVMAAAEFAQRRDNLDDVPAAELLLALGQTRAAVDYIREGNQLRADPQTALEACAAFETAGMPDEAERIFALAEPLEVLTDPNPLSGYQQRETAELLRKWVEAAPRFRPLPQILAAIDRLRREADETLFESAEGATRELRAQLRFQLAGVLRSLGRWDDAVEVVAEWDFSDEEGWGWWFWSHVDGWRQAKAAGDTFRAVELFRAVHEAAAGRELDEAERVALAEGLFRLEGDSEAARAVLEGVPQPEPLDTVAATSGRGFHTYAPRFVLNRLLGALGDERPLDEIVPPPRDHDHEALSTFERLVCLVARLHGKAWAGEVLSGGSFVLEAQPLLRFSSRPRNAARTYYLSREARDELHNLLIRAAGLHGTEAVEALRLAYDREWNDQELGARWSWDTIRAIVLALARVGADRDWVGTWLQRLEPTAFESDDVSERLRSATEQLRAYVETGRTEAARRLYRALLDASLGVGSKDDQFASWVKWAERANTADPQRAAERLSHLAACMPAIRDTEGARGVVAQLVRSGFRWHDGAGFALLDWSYQRGLLRFADGLEAALEELLTGPAPDAQSVEVVYRNFLLRLDTRPGPRLARLLADGLAVRAGAGVSLQRLAHAVRTHGMPSSRPTLLGEIDSAADAAGVERWTPVAPALAERREDTSSSEVTYFDGPPQTLEQIRVLAASVAEVRRLVACERRDSSFRWERVLPDLVSRASRAEVLELAGLFAGHARRAAIRSLLGRRLAELGDPESAWRLVEDALSETRPYGWREYFGDERIAAIQALVAVDEVRGRRLAFRTVVGDLTSGQVRATDIAFELHRIVPLLVSVEPAVQIWEDVALYVAALVAHAGMSESPAVPEPAQVPGDGLIRFAANYLDHPTYALAHAAQRTFIELLLERHPGAIRVAAEHLSSAATAQKALLVAIVAAADADPGVAAPFAELAVRLADSGEHDVRVWARQLLSVIDAPSPTPAGEQARQVAARPLPAVYGMAFAERGEVHHLREPDSTGFLPPTTDAAEIVSVFRPELDLVASLARVQPEALYQRVSQLAGAAGTPDATQAERNLRQLLDELDLKLVFRRPRSIAVRSAISRAVAELVDAGRIAAPDLADLDWLLCDGDPSMLRLDPAERPSWILPIPERDGSDYVRDGWTSAVDTGTSVLRTGIGADGSVVIAEETHLKWLDWATPTEVRWGVMVPGLLPKSLLQHAGDPLAEACGHWSHTSRADYLRHPVETKAPVILQHGYKFDTPVRRWLAFNPALARHLGWLPDPEGLFRWVDRAGMLMVESVWWEDGFEEHQPPHFRDEVGWGWLVVASPTGWKALREFYKVLFAYLVVDRSADKQEDARAIAVRRAV